MVKSKKQNNNKGLAVITTHVNADFDALASMLAAQKLYPDALVVFPGSQEKNLKNLHIVTFLIFQLWQPLSPVPGLARGFRHQFAQNSV